MAFLRAAISYPEHHPVAEPFVWGSRFLCEATWPTTGERETVPLIDPFPGSRVFTDKDVMLNAAFALASEISSKSPVAVQGSKINLIYSRDHSVDESLDYMVRPARLHPLPPIVALLAQGAQLRSGELHACVRASANTPPLTGALPLFPTPWVQATWNMSMLQTQDIIKSVQAAMEKKDMKSVSFSKL